MHNVSEGPLKPDQGIDEIDDEPALKEEPRSWASVAASPPPPEPTAEPATRSEKQEKPSFTSVFEVEPPFKVFLTPPDIKENNTVLVEGRGGDLPSAERRGLQIRTRDRC